MHGMAFFVCADHYASPVARSNATQYTYTCMGISRAMLYAAM